MKRRDVTVTAVSPSSPDAIYQLLADGSTWPQWSPIESFELERPGDSAPDGVGAIRVFRRGRTTGRDEILELVPNQRLEYAALSGLPLVDYVGEVDLAPAPGGGTTIRWHSSFSPKLRGTGWIWELGIRRFLARCADGLAKYASTSASSTGARVADEDPAA